MKIAVVSPLATVAPHFETELEIMQRHLDDGDKVDLLACTGGLACCDFNADRELDRCRDCMGRRIAGVQLLSGAVRWISFSGDCDSFELPPISSFRNLSELMRYRVGEFDIGYAVGSSLVSLTRDPAPSLGPHAALVERLFRAAWSTFARTLKYIGRNQPDRIYVFNGRFAAARAVLRACQQTQTDCWIHERGCDTAHFQIYENRLPHDIEYIQSRMREAWQSDFGSVAEKSRIAASWFADRVARIERSWHSFVKDQERGRLPVAWDARKRNVALFTSSEDEFVSIGDSWRNPLYTSQLAGIERIVADFDRCDPDLRLYIRVHPNLKNQRNASLQQLLRLSHPRVVVIAPDDPVDSYALMRNAEKTLTFGSSIGIEALYWGRPSVLLGTSFYRGLSGIYQPVDHDDAMQMIDAPLTASTDKTSALAYGYWFQTHGIRFKYFVADGLFSGRFKGQVVHAPHPKKPIFQRWLHKIRRVLSRAALS